MAAKKADTGRTFVGGKTLRQYLADQRKAAEAAAKKAAKAEDGEPE